MSPWGRLGLAALLLPSPLQPNLFFGLLLHQHAGISLRQGRGLHDLSLVPGCLLKSLLRRFNMTTAKRALGTVTSPAGSTAHSEVFLPPTEHRWTRLLPASLAYGAGAHNSHVALLFVDGCLISCLREGGTERRAVSRCHNSNITHLSFLYSELSSVSSPFGDGLDPYCYSRERSLLYHFDGRQNNFSFVVSLPTSFCPVPKYFCCYRKWNFPFPFLGCSLLMCRNTIDFSVLLLYCATLYDSLIRYNGSLVHYLSFSLYRSIPPSES